MELQVVEDPQRSTRGEIHAGRREADDRRVVDALADVLPGDDTVPQSERARRGLERPIRTLERELPIAADAADLVDGDRVGALRDDRVPAVDAKPALEPVHDRL